MTTEPYAVPTALTHLTRKPPHLEKGDGLVVMLPDGTRRHGIVESSASPESAEVSAPVFDGAQTLAVRWEES